MGLQDRLQVEGLRRLHAANGLAIERAAIDSHDQAVGHRQHGDRPGRGDESLKEGRHHMVRHIRPRRIMDQHQSIGPVRAKMFQAISDTVSSRCAADNDVDVQVTQKLLCNLPLPVAHHHREAFEPGERAQALHAPAQQSLAAIGAKLFRHVAARSASRTSCNDQSVGILRHGGPLAPHELVRQGISR